MVIVFMIWDEAVLGINIKQISRNLLSKETTHGEDLNAIMEKEIHYDMKLQKVGEEECTKLYTTRKQPWPE